MTSTTSRRRRESRITATALRGTCCPMLPQPGQSSSRHGRRHGRRRRRRGRHHRRRPHHRGRRRRRGQTPRMDELCHVTFLIHGLWSRRSSSGGHVKPTDLPSKQRTLFPSSIVRFRSQTNKDSCYDRVARTPLARMSPTDVGTRGKRSACRRSPRYVVVNSRSESIDHSCPLIRRHRFL